MEKLIRQKSLEISSVFQNIAKNGCFKILHYNIDVDKLNSKYAKSVNITEEGDFVEMFKELIKDEEYPALYIFKVNPEIDSKIIIDAIDSLGDTNIPAHYKNPINKGVLYIGKVKSFAWGRLIQHMGYHKNENSHGLHLDKWATKIEYALNLSYSVYYFEKESANYLELLENEVSNDENYKPIIGKH